jgi:MoaA/NifB/PqqE/SkfB family radical SAM enzyme
MTIELLPQEIRKSNLEKLKLIGNQTLKHSAEQKLALIEMPFFDLVIQDGPYCPKTCSHCYGDFGPNKPKAPIKLYETVAKQIPNTQISQIIITDGEPIHDIDRLENIIQLLKDLPIELNSNAEFAKTISDAENIFYRIKNSGITFEPILNRAIDSQSCSTIAFSADKYHGLDSYSNIVNAVLAFKNVYPENAKNNLSNKENHTYQNLAVTTLYERDDTGKNNKQALQEVKKLIIDPIRKHYEKSSYQNLKKNKEWLLTKDLSLLILAKPVEYDGRAKNFIREQEEVEYTPELTMPPSIEAPLLYLRSNGELYYGPSYHCTVPGKSLGNIFNEPMSELIQRKMQEPLFKMERERGVRGIYQFLYDKLNMKIKARNHCNLCQNIFSDKEDISELNKALKNSWEIYESKLRLESKK